MGNEERTLTLVLKARDAASKELANVGKGIDGLGGAAKLAAVTGIGALVGGLLMAGKAAAEEQINVAKLDTALKASVPGWQGNTDAIEATIAAREGLAFSDDALRSSLATLVTSTHDVSEAERLQTIAMDLARLKGVDLQTATEAVTKATQGSTKELKALGLTIDDSATASDNLAAIQKAAAGQSEAYAKTVAGKWEILQTKIGDVVETVGGPLLDVFSSALTFAIDNVIPVVENIAGAFSKIVEVVWGGGSGPLPVAIGAISKVFGGLFELLGDVLGIVGGIIKAAQDAFAWLSKIGQSPSDLSKLTAPKSGAPPGVAGARAGGGPVWPGSAFLVGEHGRELFVPATAGSIVPLSKSSGAPVVISLQLDGRELARVVDSHLYYALRSASALTS